MGNSALICVRRDQDSGESASSFKSSMVGCSTGTFKLVGPRNITFSVLESTTDICSSSKNKIENIIMYLHLSDFGTKKMFISFRLSRAAVCTLAWANRSACRCVYPTLAQ